MRPSTWTTIDAEMRDWLKSVNALRCGDPYPIEKIADSHAAFERVHPFIDGNDRAGRLLMNLVLVRLGMPPAIIYNRDRERYLVALDHADNGDGGALAELLARAVLNNLNRLMLPKLAGSVRLAPIAALAKDEISHSALRSAAQRRSEGGPGQARAVAEQSGERRRVPRPTQPAPRTPAERPSDDLTGPPRTPLGPHNDPRPGRHRCVAVGDEFAVDAHPPGGHVLLDPLGGQPGPRCPAR